MESGPSQTKRRLRVSPHRYYISIYYYLRSVLTDHLSNLRSVRPKHRERTERAPSTAAIPSTSSGIHSCPTASSSGSSPTPSHSGPEPSSSYHVEDETGNGYNSGDEYGPARSICISEEEWEQVSHPTKSC